ncbi:mannose-1-phosphate guanylyltransferase/mannose-6-phosphate isomerase [Alphaproteobacteria bacterium]|nr:mannose-1-phosphate guanylyltransferase/mannose-6-phosphate isomerase [Alphaproteobacteria bacterium]
MRKLYPVVLAGGIGTRLWPLSRSAKPKQFLPLLNEETSLFQDTVERLTELTDQAVIVITNEEHRFLAAEQLRERNMAQKAIILEPIGRNTAAAAAVAALEIVKDDPDGLMLLAPSDHAIVKRDQFTAAVKVAIEAASQADFVLFGIEPDRPETGFGYINAPGSTRCCAATINRFVEKPPLETAVSYLQEGGWYWNSGIFVFPAARYLAELERLEPAIYTASKAAWQRAETDMWFLRLNEEEFAKSPSKSIDYAVIEHSESASVVPIEMGWSDLGSFQALHKAHENDDDANSIVGDVIAKNVTNSYLRGDGILVAAVGVDNLMVVASDDAVVVSPLSDSQNVKAIVEELEVQKRREQHSHSRTYRPWGWYQSLSQGDRYQVKRIQVKPGAKLSLQSHKYRSEHWIVVKGTMRVTLDDKVFDLIENQSTYVPLGTIHRLENPGDEPAELIEVQSGSYLGEDDIVRYEDIYGRTPPENKS